MRSSPTLTTAAHAVARLSDTGSERLNRVIRQKFILPELERVKSLAEARRLHMALGAECAAILARVSAKKMPAMLKALGWPAEQIEQLSEGAQNALLRDLFSGTREPPAAARPVARRAGSKNSSKIGPKTSPKTSRAAALPDVRALYKDGGNARVYLAICKLTAPKLKTLVREQNIVASEPAGAKKEELLRYVQLALKEELGRHADWIGAMAERKPAA